MRCCFFSGKWVKFCDWIGSACSRAGLPWKPVMFMFPSVSSYTCLSVSLSLFHLPAFHVPDHPWSDPQMWRRWAKESSKTFWTDWSFWRRVKSADRSRSRPNADSSKMNISSLTWKKNSLKYQIWPELFARWLGLICCLMIIIKLYFTKILKLFVLTNVNCVVIR